MPTPISHLETSHPSGTSHSLAAASLEPRPAPDPRRFWRWMKKSWPGRYGVALAFYGIALLLQLELRPLMSTSPFLFFYGAVMVAGWWEAGDPRCS